MYAEANSFFSRLAQIELELNVDTSYKMDIIFSAISIFFAKSVEIGNFVKSNSVPLPLQTTEESYENFILLRQNHLDINVISESLCVHTLVYIVYESHSRTNYDRAVDECKSCLFP